MGDTVAGDRLNLLYWSGSHLTSSEHEHGLCEDEFRRRCSSITSLEMFMNSLPDPHCLADSPNLCELALHVQNIPRPVGLDRLTRLERLCMTEVRLTTMEGIEHCQSLTHLDLSSNSLAAMDARARPRPSQSRRWASLLDTPPLAALGPRAAEPPPHPLAE